jgi:nucleoside-diphosphate-sugar epimerase
VAPSAIVTGATGFVGSHLVDLLLERGWRVSAALRRTSPTRWLDGKPVERLVTDFTRPFRLPPCDVVFHAAGVIRAFTEREYLEGNRDAALRTFEASDAGRFVLVSTLAVQGPLPDCDETAPCVPVSLYGRSKWEGEHAVWERRGRMPVTVVRPPVVYGPRDLGLLELFKAVAQGIRPVIGGPKRVSLVHARDLAEGILRAAERPEGANEVFYVSHAEAQGMDAVLRRVERLLGVNAVELRIPDRVVRGLGALAEFGARLLGKPVMFCRDKAIEMTQPHWVCSPAKAERLLGWKAAVGLEQGLEETLAWYRREGFLRS